MANMTRFDPFNDLVDDLFKGFLVRPVAYEGSQRGVLPRIKVDVAEKDGAYQVTADLPGVKKEDIQVAIDGAQVTLNAEVRREKDSRRGRARAAFRARVRQGLAQLLAAAGAGRGEGRSQIPRWRAGTDAAEEGRGGAQGDHDPVRLKFEVKGSGPRRLFVL